MDATEVLEIYKKHERNTRPDLAAILMIGEVLGNLNETVSNILGDIHEELRQIKKELEQSL